MAAVTFKDVLEGLELAEDVSGLFDGVQVTAGTSEDIVVEFFNPETGSLHPKPYSGSADVEAIRQWLEGAVEDAIEMEKRELEDAGQPVIAGALEVLVLRAKDTVLIN